MGYYYFSDGAYGYPLVEEEVNAKTQPEYINTDYFGVDNSLQGSTAYGIHYLNGGSWQVWGASSLGTPDVFSDSPPVYHGIDHYYSFRVSEN